MTCCSPSTLTLRPEGRSKQENTSPMEPAPNAPTSASNPSTYAELKRSLSGLTYEDVRVGAATYEASPLKYTTEAS